MTQHHTPGPWRWHMSGGYAMLVSVPLRDADPWNPQMSGQIADDGSAGGEYRVILDPNSPNGKLIAAAPELLAACKYAHKRLDHEQGCENGDISSLLPCTCGYGKIEAAIAKASPQGQGQGRGRRSDDPTD